MRALSIRQPYAELIPSTYSGQALRRIKKIEYRSLPTTIIGEKFYIYAAMQWPSASDIKRFCTAEVPNLQAGVSNSQVGVRNLQVGATNLRAGATDHEAGGTTQQVGATNFQAGAPRFTAGGIRYIERGDYAPEPVAPKPKRIVQPRAKHVAAARELRDWYLEQINSGACLPEGQGKYDVSRQLVGPGEKETRLLAA